MPDYALAQIYSIKSRTDETFLYVSSTCRDLAAVMAKKKCDNKNGRHESNELFSKVAGNWDDVFLQLVEVYPCENLKQLREREDVVKKEMGAFNIRRDKEAKQKKQNQYYKDNVSTIAERHKIYEITHREERKRTEYQRAYRLRRRQEREQI